MITHRAESSLRNRASAHPRPASAPAGASIRKVNIYFYIITLTVIVVMLCGAGQCLSEPVQASRVIIISARTGNLKSSVPVADDRRTRPVHRTPVAIYLLFGGIDLVFHFIASDRSCHRWLPSLLDASTATAIDVAPRLSRR